MCRNHEHIESPERMLTLQRWLPLQAIQSGHSCIRLGCLGKQGEA